jgi:kynurenine formamidase
MRAALNADARSANSCAFRGSPPVCLRMPAGMALDALRYLAASNLSAVATDCVDIDVMP